MFSSQALSASAIHAKRTARMFMAALGGLWLAACAMTAEQTRPMMSVSVEPQIETFDQWLGAYRSLDDEALNLEISREPLMPSSPQKRRYLWTQWPDGGADNPRRFLIMLEGGGDTLKSSFAPLTEPQDATRRCPIDWQMTTTPLGRPALLGFTTASECRFAHADGDLGLVKEWSFDGDQIEVADQLFDLATGQPHQAAQLIEFVRVTRYAGWAAVSEGDEWRVDEGVVALSDGQRRATRDAAGMPLGLALTLERRRPSTGDPSLHLVISDAETGQVLGQAWSTSDADKIGWANADIQVELTRQSPD
ncbi:MAG TPA: hypothetical protein VIC53_02530 [Wenzhouxiangella sp.]